MHPALIAAVCCALTSMTSPLAPDASPPPLAQNWSDTGLIAMDDDWSRVPAIVGYRGDGIVTEPGIDPREVLSDGSTTPVDVTANRTDPGADGLAAGVAEFELPNPVVAIEGSATAGAPHLLIALDMRGRAGIAVTLLLRDIDASTADAVEPVAVQYRVGGAGDFANAPGGYVADATTGPGEAVAVTAVRTTLPAAVDDRQLVHLRVITTDATGDEWVGVDDLEVSAATAAGPGGCGRTDPPPHQGPAAAAPVPVPSPLPEPQPLPLPEPEPGPARLGLTGLTLSPDTFTSARRGPAIVRRGRAGAGLRFRLSKPAVVRFHVVRWGERLTFQMTARGGSVRPQLKPASERARFQVRGRRGLNRMRFTGRIRGRAPRRRLHRNRCRDRPRGADLGASRSALQDRRRQGLELAHVGAAGRERRSPDLAVGRFRLQPLHQAARLLPVAPEQHRRPGAGDRRADRAQVLRAVDQLHGSRVQVAAARLVDQIAETAADQAEVVLRQPQHEQRGMAHVVNRLADRQLRGHRRARRRRWHLVVGDRQHALEAGRRVEPHRSLAGARADDEAAVERGSDVVRVALELGGELEERGIQLVHVVRRRKAGDDRRRARPEARRHGDLRADLEADPVGAVKPFEGAHAEVGAVGRHVGHVRVHEELARLLHLELELQRQGGRQHVVARAEVGRRRRHAHHPVAPHSSTARSTLSMSGSHGTTLAARFIAVCGSFSPWPVSTHTTRPSAPFFKRPATEAAEAGSQNTPSRAPSSE